MTNRERIYTDITNTVLPSSSVIPAQAGTQFHSGNGFTNWFPACAGMTIQLRPSPTRMRYLSLEARSVGEWRTQNLVEQDCVPNPVGAL
jgi:hypothetical protein